MWPNMPEGACMVPVMIPESAVPQQGTVKNVELLEARVDYLEAALLRAEANILDLRGNPISPEQLQEIENRASAALQKLKAAQQKSK